MTARQVRLLTGAVLPQVPGLWPAASPPAAGGKSRPSARSFTGSFSPLPPQAFLGSLLAAGGVEGVGAQS